MDIKNFKMDWQLVLSISLGVVVGTIVYTTIDKYILTKYVSAISSAPKYEMPVPEA